MIKLRSESGSILLAAFSILALLAIVLSSVIVYGAWHKARMRHFLEKVQATYLAEAGLNRAVSMLHDNLSVRASNREVRIDSISAFSFSILPWGGYLRLESTGTAGRTRQTEQALLGMLPPDLFSNVLSLTGPPYPLVVAGTTVIIGDVMVGPAGVAAGELRGQSYLGKELIRGNIKVSPGESIPNFDPGIICEFLDSIEQWRQSCANVTDLAIYVQESDVLGDQQQQSCRTTSEVVIDVSDTATVKSPRLFFSDRAISIKGSSRVSGIVFSSEELINVSGSASLRNCILVSPKVIIGGSALVSGQIIADDSITVTGDATLSDFTFVYLRGRQKQDAIEGIARLASGHAADAFVAFAWSSRESSVLESSPRLNGRIAIAPESQLIGIAWSDGFLELEGRLKGSAATNLLYYDDPPTTYLNWVVDAQLEYATGAHQRVLPLVFTKEPRLEFRRVTCEN